MFLTPISNDQDIVERRTHPGTFFLQQHPQEGIVGGAVAHGPVGQLPLAVIVVEIVRPIPEALPQVGLYLVHVVLRTPHHRGVLVDVVRGVRPAYSFKTLEER